MKMSTSSNNFIRQIVMQDILDGKFKQIITRFPPEPNGYLHIGHAKSICLNFGLSSEFGGRTHLRYDDTNPSSENQLYINSIAEDVRWLGFDWGDHCYYASDYFDQLYQWAELLIEKGLAYVDFQSPEQIRLNRGSITKPGVDSPYRNSSISENLDIFRDMKDGKYKEGECVLRAKIDMRSGNMNMRDPVIYRIMHIPHPRTGSKWCIYPTYDFSHGQSDSIESITHSICTLEFELHRPLYEWFQEQLGIEKTRQIEFARLNLTHNVTSKRKLLELVNENYVSGWDDPRMPTISGLRRRGCPPEALVDFCNRIGVTKRENAIQIELLECCIRECMNKTSKRLFGVTKPLLIEIENFNDSETITVSNHPSNPEFGTRDIIMEKYIYIESDDFQLEHTNNFYRLSPGKEVRLRYSYWIKCKDVIYNGDKICKLICTYDPDTANGKAPPDGRKVKATIHWIGRSNAIESEFRMYNRLFNSEEMNENWKSNINNNSLIVYTGFVESYATKCRPGDPIQFERVGYFTPDLDSTIDKPVYNLTVSLIDMSNIEKKKIEAERREQIANERRMAKANKNKKN